MDVAPEAADVGSKRRIEVSSFVDVAGTDEKGYGVSCK